MEPTETESTSAALLNLNMQPKNLINADGSGYTFRGNHSQTDHFKLLERDGDSLLVGARNAVYNLSMGTLMLHQKLEWPASFNDMQSCQMKGKDSEECNNYIRVLVRHPLNGKTLICGTNAFRPLCRQYSMLEDGQYQMHREFDGFAISPYDPRTNSTAFYLSETDEIFTGTHSDFAATDPLIYRKSLSGTTPELRSPRHDLKLLNDPHFVFSFADRDHVYFWFRETASECNTCEKSIYGRVARVCKKDMGSASHPDEWTSFVKARLNCSIPGDIPFHFDELQAAAAITRGNYGGKEAEIVYTVFTTPYQGVQMSAVCAFSMDELRSAFTNPSFKAQSSAQQWMTALKDLPSPRLGACADNSKLLSDKVVNFVKKNPLVDDSVRNFFDQPLIIDTNFRSKLTQIAVHAQVQAVSGLKYDVLFVGTDDGRVLKVVNVGADSGRTSRSVLVETVQVFPAKQSVENLLVYAPASSTNAFLSDDSMDFVSSGANPFISRLVVVSHDEVKAMPLNYCSNMTTCSACIRLQDPYCAWDVSKRKCVGKVDGNWLDSDYAQNIASGISPLCPDGEVDNNLYLINELYPQRATVETPLIYTAESMAVAVVLTLAVASVLGFIIGYRLAVMKAENANSSCASSSLYESALLRQKLANCEATLPLTNHVDVYGCPTTAHNQKLNDLMNVVVTVPPDQSKNDKNSFVLNNGTLPKDYKSRKVYL